MKQRFQDTECRNHKTEVLERRSADKQSPASTPVPTLSLQPTMQAEEAKQEVRKVRASRCPGKGAGKEYTTQRKLGRPEEGFLEYCRGHLRQEK